VLSKKKKHKALVPSDESFGAHTMAIRKVEESMKKSESEEDQPVIPVTKK